ncbi:uncharacterized protein BDZ99DRAFT_525824 [Mytilinidion resinicola]|uniref:Uncharacterized protein n=1 Tax=Mytilinidion resinicola TaxID=574789 RepID=A0A6A6Y615_9PEZI|nr:uncharacterized protein BDZ99DRAFT_525824 [Mytilinidion resinicola]KAF2804232.1 hypothetical protein BDZ99DRAFT_525824 [Mytilinidion resinicola]
MANWIRIVSASFHVAPPPSAPPSTDLPQHSFLRKSPSANFSPDPSSSRLPSQRKLMTADVSTGSEIGSSTRAILAPLDLRDNNIPPLSSILTRSTWPPPKRSLRAQRPHENNVSTYLVLLSIGFYIDDEPGTTLITLPPSPLPRLSLCIKFRTLLLLLLLLLALLAIVALFATAVVAYVGIYYRYIPTQAIALSTHPSYNESHPSSSPTARARRACPPMTSSTPGARQDRTTRPHWWATGGYVPCQTHHRDPTPWQWELDRNRTVVRNVWALAFFRGTTTKAGTRGI